MSERMLRRGVRRLRGGQFCDIRGLVLFLGALVLFGATWRVGVVTSNLTAEANTILAVADGQLQLEQLVYTVNEGESPGTRVVGGVRYGREYAQAVLALPVLWVLRAIGGFVAPGVAIAAAWSAAVAGFAVALGSLFEDRRRFGAAGAGVAVVLFIANVTASRSLPADLVPAVALGIPILIAGALLPVVLYRLVAKIHGRQVGAAAGSVALLATPVAFWATIPRRHSVVGLLVIGAVAAFHTSKTQDEATAVRGRALAYSAAGLATWFHVVDGLVLLAALLLVDLTTRQRATIRERVTVGCALALSLLPFALTAALTSGAVVSPLQSVVRSWSPIAVADLDNWLAVIGRSAFSSTPIAYARVGPVNLKVAGEPIALSVPEAMPLVGILVSGPIVLYQRMDTDECPWSVQAGPVALTDYLVVTYVLLLLVTYVPSIPAESSVTLRRLHPLYPLGVYLLARLPIVRASLSEWRLAARFYGGVVGGGLLTYVFVVGPVTSGPHVVAQLHTTATFALAAILGYWGVVTAWTGESYARSMTLTAAAAAGLSTLFILLSAFVYFPTRWFALPASRVVADVLTVW